jgi:hypothetical protein
MRLSNSFFAAQGILNLGHSNPYGNYGFHDTLMAGPFEVYQRDLFSNDGYLCWTKAVGLGHKSLQPREQFFKSLWLRMIVAPIDMHWFCDLHFFHKVEFKPRCLLPA